MPSSDLAFRRRTPWGVTVVVKNLLTGEEKELDNIKSIDYQAGKNTAASWSISLDNKSRRYSKYNQDSDLYTYNDHSWITPDVWATPSEVTGTITWTEYNDATLKDETQVFHNMRIGRVVIITVRRGNMIWQSPYLVIKNYNYSANPNSGYDVTISGTDFTEALMVENVTFATKWTRRELGVTYTAHSITKAILKTMGVANYQIDFTDYDIWKLHMQGSRPMDMLERIWAVVRVIWYWRGNTLYVKNYELKKDGPADITFTSGINIKTLSLGESSTYLINCVEIRRDIEAQVYNSEEGTSVGPITVSISPPLFMFDYHFEFRWCQLGEGTWVTLFDVNDNFVDAYDKTTPVAKAVFFLVPWQTEYGGATWQTPGGPIEGDTPYWKMEYRGLSQYVNLDSWDQSFAVRVKNQTSINTWGERRNPDPYEDPLIPNAVFARRLGEKLLEESGRAKETMTLDVLFDPFIEPNMTAKVVDAHLGVNHYFYIENVSWSLPSMRCSVSMVKYTQ